MRYEFNFRTFQFQVLFGFFSDDVNCQQDDSPGARQRHEPLEIQCCWRSREALGRCSTRVSCMTWWSGWLTSTGLSKRRECFENLTRPPLTNSAKKCPTRSAPHQDIAPSAGCQGSTLQGRDPRLHGRWMSICNTQETPLATLSLDDWNGNLMLCSQACENFGEIDVQRLRSMCENDWLMTIIEACVPYPKDRTEIWSWRKPAWKIHNCQTV